MNKTTIDYLTHTWNPLAMRCSKVSPACDNCWHLAIANRLSKNPVIGDREREAYAGGKPVLIEHALDSPRRMKKPARIGVQFMGDLFHDSVTDYALTRIFAAMLGARQHTFILLTKRPEQMLDYFENFPWGKIPDNLWVGVTVENQEWADKRIPVLLEIPSAIRFVSVEPMLSAVDLTHVVIDGSSAIDALTGTVYTAEYEPKCYPGATGKIDWIICGGETGPGARPMHPDWVRSLRDQCVSVSVPFFLKSWGEWAPFRNDYDVCNDNRYQNATMKQVFVGGLAMNRIGKKLSGRLLDGQIWEEYPEVKR